MDRVTKQGKVIKHMPISASNFLNVSTILYGPSKSGKSVTGQHILYELANAVAMIWVLCPTEPQNGDYKGRVPKAAIRVNCEPKQILALLQTLWDRQMMASAMYQKAMNLSTLTGLYKRVRTSENDKKLTNISTFFDQAFRRLERFNVANGSAAMPLVSEKEKAFYENEKEKLSEQKEKVFVAFFRQSIGPFRDQLLANTSITEDERYTLRYLFFNPNSCVVMDDVAAQLLKIQKTALFTDYFYKGRHAKMTTIVVAQDDTDMEANIRKNAFQSIFCTSSVAQSFFGRASNGFGKKNRDEVEDINTAVFTGTEGDHAKLIWQRLSPHPFQYILPKKINERKKLGSPAFWDYCQQIEIAGDAPLDKSNAFFTLFA